MIYLFSMTGHVLNFYKLAQYWKIRHFFFYAVYKLIPPASDTSSYWPKLDEYCKISTNRALCNIRFFLTSNQFYAGYMDRPERMQSWQVYLQSGCAELSKNLVDDARGSAAEVRGRGRAGRVSTYGNSGQLVRGRGEVEHVRRPCRGGWARRRRRRRGKTCRRRWLTDSYQEGFGGPVLWLGSHDPSETPISKYY
jgi:hypothetical protein